MGWWVVLFGVMWGSGSAVEGDGGVVVVLLG